jgi:hypothetical protein
MYRHLFGTALVSAAAVLAVAVGATPVVAATATWTVTPGGSFYTSSPQGTSRLTDTTTGTLIRCPDVFISGTFKTGAGVANPVGRITSVGNSNFVPGQSFGCDLGSTGNVLVTFSAMGFRAVRYDAAKDLTYGAFTAIHATFTGADGYACSGILAGSSATASNGLVRFQYSDSSGSLLTYRGSGNLHIYNVSGCGDLINSGDALSLRAGFLIVSRTGATVDTITSP